MKTRSVSGLVTALTFLQLLVLATAVEFRDRFPGPWMVILAVVVLVSANRLALRIRSDLPGPLLSLFCTALGMLAGVPVQMLLKSQQNAWITAGGFIVVTAGAGTAFWKYTVDSRPDATHPGDGPL